MAMAVEPTADQKCQLPTARCRNCWNRTHCHQTVIPPRDKWLAGNTTCDVGMSWIAWENGLDFEHNCAQYKRI